ncbi:RNA polymerase sigma factor SigZ [Pseudoalteromonas phenolica]|uniref:RNA polymerase sigma factor SigZ n=1 Tax=Pseudoalteromonas phenolica TaxID=161398 RepID=A0A5S3YXT7_9GAMM|nr:RNA polymerase sigma factor SigZ [Pseudoalteromonas phenolica]TMP83373.1 RNA polymerase sigma factor SigZ [Pseudoalteromonas phenolica]
MSIEQIWAEYKNSLHAFLLSKVSNPADAEELLQDILLKTHLQIHQLKDQASIKPWLFQIANHAIIDFYRKHNNYQYTELFEVIEKQEANIRADLIRCIEPFLQAMPEDEADLIRKIDLEGCSQKQQAEQLGVSYSTFKSRMQKSRADLKVLFDRCCDFELDKQGNLIDYHRKPQQTEKRIK